MGGGGGTECQPWDIECRAKKAAGDVGTSLGLGPNASSIINALPNVSGIARDVSNTANREVSNLSNDTNRAIDQGISDLSNDTNYAIDNSIGELTGRNDARKAAKEAKAAIAAEQVQRARDTRLQQDQRYIRDLGASRAVGSRRSTLGRSQGYTTTEQDFLGL